MAAPTLVELCAGSAAVSLQWLSPSGKPPIGYLGGKRGHAGPILDAIGLAPGGGARDGRIVLVEAGPWGEAWALWRTPAGRRDTCERLRAWSDRDPRELWQQLKAAPVPIALEERVATWAVVQRGSFGSFPAFVVGDHWRWSQRAGRATPHTVVGPRMEIDDVDVGEVARRVAALPDLSAVEVVHADARSVAPIPGARVVLDPPYRGTTGYGFDLPRPEVIALAQRWSDAGAVVAVCESGPIEIPGWSTAQIARDEWLTLSRPPAHRQASLFGAAAGLSRRLWPV